jgi:hypothetical protein
MTLSGMFCDLLWSRLMLMPFCQGLQPPDLSGPEDIRLLHLGLSDMHEAKVLSLANSISIRAHHRRAARVCCLMPFCLRTRTGQPDFSTPDLSPGARLPVQRGHPTALSRSERHARGVAAHPPGPSPCTSFASLILVLLSLASFYHLSSVLTILFDRLAVLGLLTAALSHAHVYFTPSVVISIRSRLPCPMRTSDCFISV